MDSNENGIESQFTLIKDLIQNRSGPLGQATAGKTLSSEDLHREMASQQLLKEIGVDIQKFLEGGNQNDEGNQIGKIAGTKQD